MEADSRVPKKNIQDFESFISQYNSFCIVMHVNPDGDAIGSALGLMHFLNNIGKETVVITPNDYPAFLQWLPGQEKVYNHLKEKYKSESAVKSCEALFCVDFNDVERAGNSADVIRKFGGASFLIDHHPVREQFTDFRICDVSYCATAELLFELAEKSKFAEYINREVAESLFTGILTDTGSFQHASSDPRIFINVGKLLSYGLNKDEIHEKVYDNYSSARMQLMGSALKDNMTILDDVNTAYITLSLAELKHYHYEPGDTEGFVNLPLSIKGIRFSVFFMERYDHIKLSLRSKGNFPANEFASKYYQGGGHKNAAGGRFYGTLEQAVENFEDNLNEYKKELTE